MKLPAASCGELCDYFVRGGRPPPATPQQQSELEKIAEIIITKKSDRSADVSALEAEIDQMVYKLYDLKKEEIAIVEGKK